MLALWIQLVISEQVSVYQGYNTTLICNISTTSILTWEYNDLNNQHSVVAVGKQHQSTQSTKICLLKNFAKLGDKSERYRLCLFTGFQTKGNFSDGRFSVMFDDTNNTTELTITDLRSSDEGEYSCAEFQHDGETQKWDLQVYGEIMDQLLKFLRRFHLVVSQVVSVILTVSDRF